MSNFIVPAIVIIVLIVFFTMVPVGLWITARFSGVNISMGSLVAMRFRRLNPSLIVNALIKSHQAGLEIRTEVQEKKQLSLVSVKEL